jgi:formate dehydrogenase iron-sulfur subunit
MYVLPHGDPALYRLPAEAQVSPLVALWRGGVAKTLGVLTMVSVVVAGFFHYMKVGPLEVPGEKEE